MGRIKHIEVENFKSYGGKQIIGPFVDFTCVVGPNGGGKSNLTDAICFVMGLHAKELRGKQMSDLIWHTIGKDGRFTSTAKSASVTMVFIADDGELAGIDGGSEVRFSRSISAQGTTQYRFNGKEQTWEAYSKLLEELNIITKARNFLVFQGDVEGLAKKSSKELLNHFETFCGSADFKVDYEKSHHDWTVAAEACRVKRASHKATEIERKSIKGELEEANKFSRARDERDRLRVQQALWRLYHVQARIGAEDEGFAAANEALSAASLNEEQFTLRVTKAAENVAKAQKDLIAKDKVAAGFSRTLLKANAKTDEMEQLMASSSARGDEIAAGRKKLASESEKQRLEITSLQDEIAELNSKLEALDESGGTSKAAAKGKKGKGSAGEATSGAISLATSDRAEYNKLKATERQRTADLREALAKLQRLQTADDAEAAKAKATLDILILRDEGLVKDRQSMADRQETLQKGTSKLEAERADKQQELEEARVSLKRDGQRMETLGAELEDVKAALAAHRDARKRTDNERRVDAAIEDLKRLFPGVRGRLFELTTPTQKKYGTAVSTALGRLCEAIVVNNEATSFECIQYLRDNKIRSQLFLPLDTLVVQDIDDRLTTLLSKPGSQLRLVRDIIRYEPELERAVYYACENTVVCDTLAAAKDLRFKKEMFVKTVTIDGTVIAKNGNMTGGVSGTDADLARVSRWDEKEAREAAARRDALLSEEEALRRRSKRGHGADSSSLHVLVEDAETLLKTNAIRYAGLAKEVENTKKRIKESSAESTAIASQIVEHRKTLAELAGRIETRKAELDAQQAKVHGIADEVFGSFAGRLGLSSIRDYETAVVERQAADMQARREITEYLSKLTSKLEYERSVDRSRTLADLDKQLAKIKAEVEEYRTGAKDAHASLQKAKAEEAAAKDAAAKARSSLPELDALKESAAKEREAVVAKKAALAKESASRQTTVDRLRHERHDLLARVQTSQLTLPLKAAAAATATAADKRKAKGSKRKGGAAAASDDEDDDMGGGNAVVKRVFSQLSVTDSLGGDEADGADGADDRRAARIDFSKLTLDTVDVSPEEVEETAAKLEIQVHTQEGIMSRLTPNLKASAMLEDVEKQLAAESAEVAAARLTQQEAENRYREVAAARRSLFEDAFTTVQKAIDTIYKDLTVSPSHPVGGTARLSLENSDDPFDSEKSGVRYTVQPPGKQFRDMQQLSGGEQTIAALALLFALHAHRPAPFFIMDEVDAHLDNHNVYKLSTYIRRRACGGSGDLQAIVVSHKDTFYESASGLVGVFREQSAEMSSTVSINLDAFRGDKISA